MWFFDNVLEEKTMVTADQSTPAQSYDQDGSFLIIDSVTVADIPDSAVQLFEETPAITEETPAQTEEIQEVQMIAPIEEASSAAFTDFLSEPTSESAEDIVSQVEDIAPVIAFSEDIASQTIVWGSSATAPAKKMDPNEILANAVKELETLLAGHAKLAEAEDAMIARQNVIIADAKLAAKKSLDERKKIDAAIVRVTEMKNLFISQMQK